MAEPLEPAGSAGTGPLHPSNAELPTDRAYHQVKSDPAYVREEKWANSFEADLPDEALEFWFGYARSKYEEAEANCRALDEKAEGIVRHAMVAGTLMAGVVGALAKDGRVIVAFAVPLVAAVIAVLFALGGRRPRIVPTPPDVRFALEWCAYEGGGHQKAKRQIILSLHKVTVAQVLVASQKGRAVGRALTGLCVTLALVVVCLVFVGALNWPA